MKFIYENTEKKSPTFGDVEENQFFVGDHGNLFQKVSKNKANKIATDRGLPFADSDFGFDPHCPIARILPKVIKIEF